MAAFNHYAKIKRILAEYSGEWYVMKINRPTSAKKFNGETVYYDHYYRVYDAKNQPIKYCKFQQLDRFAAALSTAAHDIPVIEQD
jgi:hypothetical protein